MIALQHLDHQIHVSVLLIKDMQVSCIHTISKVSKISINALQCLAQQLHVSILPRMYMQVAGLHNTCKYPTYQACCGRRQEHVGALTFAGLHGRMVPASLAQHVLHLLGRIVFQSSTAGKLQKQLSALRRQQQRLTV